jgi:hypothetical protein
LHALAKHYHEAVEAAVAVVMVVEADTEEEVAEVMAEDIMAEDIMAAVVMVDTDITVAVMAAMVIMAVDMVMVADTAMVLAMAFLQVLH